MFFILSVHVYQVVQQVVSNVAYLIILVNMWLTSFYIFVNPIQFICIVFVQL